MIQHPRKHHYLPQFYTKWWAGADRKLIRYTRPTSAKLDIKTVYPSEVGWQRDLYSYYDKDGNLTQVIETEFLKKVDDRAARALSKLNGDLALPLSAIDTNSWTIFIQSLLLRSPDHIAFLKIKAKKEFSDSIPMLRNAYPRLRSDDDPATFDQYMTKPDSIDIENMAMQIFPQMTQNPNIGRFIHGMSWSYRTVPDDCHGFLLCDDPVIRTNGLDKKHGHLVLPLSPRRLFIATRDLDTQSMLSRMDIREVVKTVNTQIVSSARRFVISMDRSQNRFIANRFGSVPRPSIAG